ncbi:MAG: hypothetical protein CME65_03800 [Halobacteriovoraceae bacterium]|nr:hypothetical protein [Halobacteriovoraceae bacterium]|tara:strand:+ start:4593 stop:5660 length:1068 start_codon:yes stop_codon:yes gene_type:complete
MKLILLVSLTVIFSNLALASIEKIENEFKTLGLKNVSVSKIRPTRLQNLREKEDRYYLEVKFGKLTRTEFEMLKNKFGHFSQVPYSSRRDYQLLDFLHPAMQAVANQTFKSQYSSMDGYFDYEGDNIPVELYMLERNGIGSFTNCWNTTLEITRMLTPHANLFEQTFHMYWPGRWQTDDLLNNEDYGQKISRKDLEYGDTVIVNSIEHAMGGLDYMLRHTAIALTPNLVFEKTDAGDNDAYRISLLEDVIQKYEGIFTVEDELQIIYKKLSDSEKAEIPTPVAGDIFGAELRELAQGHFPHVNFNSLSVGCETRMGGGCDQILTEVHRAGVRIYSRTGRGILLAPQKVLRRFQSL